MRVETGSLVFKSSAIHGMGAFACQTLVAGSRVIEYVGEVISKEESLRRCQSGNEYIFSLDDTRDMDGNVDWNPARWINHSCAPNCETEMDDGRLWIVALRDIAPGEEITFDYGYDLQNYREHPCQCGAPGCPGFIVAEELRGSVS